MCQGRLGVVQALLFVGLLLALPVTAGTIPLAPTPTTTADLIVWEGDVHLPGPIRIPEGKVLHLHPGARVLGSLNSPTGQAIPPALLIVHGELVALGSADHPISFHVPLVVEGKASGPTLVNHAIFLPDFPAVDCALTIAPTQARITNTTFGGPGDGLCVRETRAGPESSGSDPAGSPGEEQTAPRMSEIPSRSGLHPVQPAATGLASGPEQNRSQGGSPVPPSTLLLTSNRYVNNTGAGLNLTDPATAGGAGPFEVISEDDLSAGNDVGIHLGEPGASLRLTNGTIRDNRIGLLRQGGQAYLDHARFEANREWDIYATGDGSDVRWFDSYVEPSCVHVEGWGGYGCQRGSVGGVTVLTILLGLIYSLLFLVSEAGRYLLTRLWMWVRLYSRIPREELLEHEARVEIHAIVADDPGIHLRGVEDEVGGYGRTTHHLTQLERGGLLKSRREGMYLRFYPVGFDPKERGPRSMKELVMDMINKVPGIHASEIARRLDTSRQRVAHHVKTLLEEARIEVRERDRIKELYPAGRTDGR